MYRPWTVGKFGVELEFSKNGRDRSSLTAQMLRETMNAAVGSDMVDAREATWRKSDGHFWDIKTDSTAGWEIASPALLLSTEGRNTALSNVCAGLNGIGAVVTTSCGTHQHFELPGYDWRDLQRFLALWARYEPFFFELQPAARRTNHHCQPIYRGAWEHSPGAARSANSLKLAILARNQDNFDRYSRQLGRSAVNLAGWWANGRIEIRLHSGTLNANKIVNWAMLIKSVIARVKNTAMPEIELSVGPDRLQSYSTEYICKQLGLLPSRYVPDVPPESIALVSWLKARRAQFNPGQAQQLALNMQAREQAARQTASQAAPNPSEYFINNAVFAPTSEFAEPVPQHVQRARDAAARSRWEHSVPRDQRCQARIGAQRERSVLDNSAACFVDTLSGAVECPNRRANGVVLCRHHYAEWNAYERFTAVPWPNVLDAQSSSQTERRSSR